MRRIDEQYLRTPFYGSRKMAEVLSVAPEGPRRGEIVYHHYKNLLAPIASGSFLTAGMVICPCSGSTLGAVVHGTGDRFMPASEAEILHASGGATDSGPAGGAARAGRRLDLVPDMGHAFCTRGLDAVTEAVAWCLAQDRVPQAA